MYVDLLRVVADVVRTVPSRCLFGPRVFCRLSVDCRQQGGDRSAPIPAFLL